MDADTKLDLVLVELKKIFNQIDERFEKIDEKFDKIDERFDKLESRFDNLESRFDNLESRFDNLEKRFDNFEEKNEVEHKAINNMINTLNTNLYDLVTKNSFRISILEQKLLQNN